MFDEPNPNLSHALESSLWELTLLKNHYFYTVAGLAQVFEGSLAKPGYDLEDFLDHSYRTVRVFKTFLKLIRWWIRKFCQRRPRIWTRIAFHCVMEVKCHLRMDFGNFNKVLVGYHECI